MNNYIIDDYLLTTFRIISTTAHAAFDKAAAYFGIKVHTIALDSYSRQINLKLVKRAMYVFEL